jgi:peptide/nickel transport system ATP-binding protein
MTWRLTAHGQTSTAPTGTPEAPVAASGQAPAPEGRPGTPMLDVRDLRVAYRNGERAVPAVRGVSFTLDRGRPLGVAGESDLGKLHEKIGQRAGTPTACPP